MLVLSQILLVIFMLGVIGYMIYGIIADLKAAPYVPSAKNKRKTIRKLLEKISKERSAKGNDKPLTFLDLGSGSGTVVFEAADLGFDATGVEYSPYLVASARIRAKIKGIKNAKFRRGDLFSVDLSEYDVVFSYLMPKAMKKLETKVRNELRPGAVFVAESFKFPKWKPAEIENRVYVYEKKSTAD